MRRPATQEELDQIVEFTLGKTKVRIPRSILVSVHPSVNFNIKDGDQISGLAFNLCWPSLKASFLFYGTTPGVIQLTPNCDPKLTFRMYFAYAPAREPTMAIPSLRNQQLKGAYWVAVQPADEDKVRAFEQKTAIRLLTRVGSGEITSVATLHASVNVDFNPYDPAPPWYEEGDIERIPFSIKGWVERRDKAYSYFFYSYGVTHIKNWAEVLAAVDRLVMGWRVEPQQ